MVKYKQLFEFYHNEKPREWCARAAWCALSRTSVLETLRIGWRAVHPPDFLISERLAAGDFGAQGAGWPHRLGGVRQMGTGGKLHFHRISPFSAIVERGDFQPYKHDFERFEGFDCMLIFLALGGAQEDVSDMFEQVHGFFPLSE
jgi:hypothetical protein